MSPRAVKNSSIRDGSADAITAVTAVCNLGRSRANSQSAISDTYVYPLRCLPPTPSLVHLESDLFKIS
jgi:hypothetical protein